MTAKNERIVEAVLFSAGRPLAIEEIAATIRLSEKKVLQAIESLIEEYRTRGEAGSTAIEVARAGDKYAMQLSTQFASYGQQLADMEVSERLLKTVSLIAYYQPVRQSDMKDMIGGKIYDHVKELVDSGFVRAKPHGRTKMLEVTTYFYEYFGFDSTDRNHIKEYLKKKVKSQR
jgi:segregation and condensation protein B